MSSINQLQTTLQNIYNQVGANVPASKAGLIDHNVLHNLGLSANLLQNLRNDLSAVANGSNPERALNNLMSGLQQISGSTNARAKEWPADKLLPEGGVHLVKGADGQPEAVTAAKEWPAGKPLPEGGVHLVNGADGQPEAVTAAKEWPVDKPLPEGGVHLVKGADGQPEAVTAAKEWPVDKLLPEGGVHLVKGADGQPEAVTAAKEWPVDKPLPEGGVHLVKGADGQPEAVTAAKEWPVDKPLPEGGVHLVKGTDGQPEAVIAAKEWPVDKPLPEGGVHLVKGEDGQPKEVDASGVPRSDLANVPSSVQASADAVISNLVEVLGVQAAGGDISQASAKMRTALDSLFDRTNPTQVRDALRNSINELA
ncbi:hypothetical protein [Pseudomonas sp. HN8-3]|uniref:hypothetical protein n=1 Tax=Pseudomonas sp. HN8-3 TaxID=2886361 RepID=UPI001E46B787|nr:hypothetical protein [Pseudomonas sp. HN8-3]UEH08065.1 hypothetical protein LJX92_24615 [Pseudomonas sp. HN8-3]